FIDSDLLAEGRWPPLPSLQVQAPCHRSPRVARAARDGQADNPRGGTVVVERHRTMRGDDEPVPRQAISLRVVAGRTFRGMPAPGDTSRAAGGSTSPALRAGDGERRREPVRLVARARPPPFDERRDGGAAVAPEEDEPGVGEECAQERDAEAV